MSSLSGISSLATISTVLVALVLQPAHASVVVKSGNTTLIAAEAINAPRIRYVSSSSSSSGNNRAITNAVMLMINAPDTSCNLATVASSSVDADQPLVLLINQPDCDWETCMHHCRLMTRCQAVIYTEEHQLGGLTTQLRTRMITSSNDDARTMRIPPVEGLAIGQRAWSQLSQLQSQPGARIDILLDNDNGHVNMYIATAGTDESNVVAVFLVIMQAWIIGASLPLILQEKQRRGELRTKVMLGSHIDNRPFLVLGCINITTASLRCLAAAAGGRFAAGQHVQYNVVFRWLISLPVLLPAIATISVALPSRRVAGQSGLPLIHRGALEYGSMMIAADMVISLTATALTSSQVIFSVMTGVYVLLALVVARTMLLAHRRNPCLARWSVISVLAWLMFAAASAAELALARTDMLQAWYTLHQMQHVAISFACIAGARYTAKKAAAATMQVRQSIGIGHMLSSSESSLTTASLSSSSLASSAPTSVSASSSQSLRLNAPLPSPVLPRLARQSMDVQHRNSSPRSATSLHRASVGQRGALPMHIAAISIAASSSSSSSMSRGGSTGTSSSGISAAVLAASRSTSVADMPSYGTASIAALRLSSAPSSSIRSVVSPGLTTR